MTTNHRIPTTAAVILSLAAAGAPAASARPADYVPAGNKAPASVYSRPDKSMIPVDSPDASSTSVPPILPTINASQLAATEQADRQAAAYTPPKGAQYSNAETNAYADTTTGHITSAVVGATTPHNAFDWGDAGIGAAAGFMLAMLGLGGALALSQRRSPRTTALLS